MRPPAALRTWFYIASADGAFHAVSYETGKHILTHGPGNRRPLIARSWRDVHGGVTLIGVGLVVQMGRPIYIDRCVVSCHGFGATAAKAELVNEASVDFEALAGRLAVDTRGLQANIRELTAFLAGQGTRVLLEDLHVWMQEARPHLENVWLEHLVAGRQGYPLWDVREGWIHPPQQPIKPDPRVAPRKRRRPTRPTT